METERVMNFLKSNYLYLIGSFLYFIFSCLMLGGRWYSFIICLALYAVSIVIAFSPVGEWLIRAINHVRPIETKEEKGQLIALFNEVYRTAKENHPDLPYIRLYIQDTMTVNACAINSHTIAVTKGAMETFNEDELKGILFHEIAHIYYGHTAMSLLATIGNGIFSIFVLITRFLMLLLDSISDPQQDRGFGHFLFSICRFILEATLFIFMLFFNIAFAINSRSGEYMADKFAFDNGYGQDLVDALYILQRMSLGDNSSLVDQMTASHPRISKRIMTLEALLDGVN